MNVTPELLARSKAVNEALRNEMEAARRFGADKSQANYDALVAAHEASQAATKARNELPEWGEI